MSDSYGFFEKILIYFCDEKKLEKFYFWLRERFTEEEIEGMRADQDKWEKAVNEYIGFTKLKGFKEKS